MPKLPQLDADWAERGSHFPCVQQPVKQLVGPQPATHSPLAQTSPGAQA